MRHTNQRRTLGTLKGLAPVITWLVVLIGLGIINSPLFLWALFGPLLVGLGWAAGQMDRSGTKPPESMW